MHCQLHTALCSAIQLRSNVTTEVSFHRAGVPQNGRKSFPGDVARFEFEPEGDVIDKFVLKKERFQKPCCLEQ